MKNMIKKILLIFLMGAVCINTGCASKSNKAQSFENDALRASVASQEVAENSNFELLWDNITKCVLLKQKGNNEIWSTTPYAAYKEETTLSSLTSPISIMVAQTSSLQTDTTQASEAIDAGTVYSKQIDNGIEVIYHFEKYKISIPVQFVLRKDCLAVTIRSAGIKERSDYLLVSVSLTPFLCSAENKEQGAYLFIPSGSGALMYTDERADKKRVFSAEVYGNDVARQLTHVTDQNVAVRIPAFGAKRASSALLGIIDSNAEAAKIEAEAGNSRNGYSNVYATFNYRGYDIYNTHTAVTNWADYTRYSKELSTETDSTVCYYPLKSSDADYNGMARRYRQYLVDSNLLTKTENKETLYSLTIVGGMQTKALTFGFPYIKTECMTSFSEAQDIVVKALEITGTTPTVCMLGYGQSGINVGKVAGGFNFSEKFGSNQQRLDLENFCRDKNISLYTDFDLVRFNKSGEGFTSLMDSAKTATRHMAEQKSLNVQKFMFDSDQNPSHLLKRAKLGEAVSKLITIAKKKRVSGISLTALGNTAYSDYSGKRYYTKGSMAADVQSYLKQIQQNGFMVAVNEANAYAVAAADLIFDVPATDGEYNAFDYSIPFYQMVFKGVKPLYLSSINTASDWRKKLMLAASVGSGINFKLVHDYDVTYAKLADDLYSTTYSDVEDTLCSSVKEYKACFEATKGKKIISYKITDSGISETLFENNVVVYANHNNYRVSFSGEEFGAYAFSVSVEDIQ